MIDFSETLILKMLNNCVRRNSSISRLIFGVRIQGNRRIHWDFTTLALKDCLLQRVRPWHQILEVGTGPHAILSIFLAKRVPCNIVACDINEKYVINARETAKLNAASIKVVWSDLFDNIDNKFDVIFFNSIYIPRQVGKRLGIDKLHDRETDWCGGETGIETINRFLRNAPPHVKENGEILLGFNAKYLREDLVVELCDDYGYNVKARCSTFLNPSQVLVIDRRQ